MGKHAASGSSSHPLVTAALAQRTTEGGVHRDGPRPESGPESDGPDTEGPVGWPAPSSPGGGSVGWPGELPEAGSEDGPAVDEPAPRAARRGWRRLFGQPAA